MFGTLMRRDPGYITKLLRTPENYRHYAPFLYKAAEELRLGMSREGHEFHSCRESLKTFPRFSA